MTIEYQPDRDWQTVSGLRAMLQDARDMLRESNQENAELREGLDALQDFAGRMLRQVEGLSTKVKDIASRLEALPE